MGWRFRKSIGGKYFRVNIGKRGITGVTFGKRGAPHVTVGKNGTSVGSSIPGTGIYYTQKVGGAKPHRADTAQLPIVNAEPMREQTAVPPPSMPPTNPTPPVNGGNRRLPVSRLVIASVILGVLALIFAFTPAAAFGVILALVSFILGVIGMIVVVVRKKRRGTLAGFLAIALACASFVAGATNMPEESTSQPQSTENSAEASAEASKSAEAQQSAAASASAAASTAAIASAQDSLSSTITQAKALLDLSNNNVADQSTWQTLSDAIDTASAIDSKDPDDYTNEMLDIQSAMDAVTTSVEQKKKDDAAAAQKAAADNKAAEEAAVKKAVADKAARDSAAQKAAQDRAVADRAAREKAQQQKASQGGSVYYPNCAAVRAAGKAPLHPGDPGYRSKLDRDHDGLACE